MPSGMKSIHSTHEVAANPSIGSWTFDVFGLGPDDITEAVIQMFRASG